MTTSDGTNAQAIDLANCIKDWWEDHKYDVTGERGEWNLYDDEPKFVTMAKAIIGDWERTPDDDL